jgi:hypothetical protein
MSKSNPSGDLVACPRLMDKSLACLLGLKLHAVSDVSVMNIYSFPLFSLFYYATIHMLITWSISFRHSLTLLIIPTFHFIYAYHIPILSHYYLRSSLLLSYVSIFHLIFTASYLFDYLCTSYIPTYCSTFRSPPIGHSTPLISWHYLILSFPLSSKYSLCSYW